MQQCCPDLDAQEGRGLLAADALGGKLVLEGAAPTEAHMIGLQIDNWLEETKEAEAKLRQAARTRKSKARSKQQAQGLDEKFQ